MPRERCSKASSALTVSPGSPTLSGEPRATPLSSSVPGLGRRLATGSQMSNAAVVLQPVAGVRAEPALKRELGMTDLTLFAITCITSARWIPIAAHAGPSSVTLWLLAGLLFVVPLTIAVAALVVKYPAA